MGARVLCLREWYESDGMRAVMRVQSRCFVFEVRWKLVSSLLTAIRDSVTGCTAWCNRYKDLMDCVSAWSFKQYPKITIQGSKGKSLLSPEEDAEASSVLDAVSKEKTWASQLEGLKVNRDTFSTDQAGHFDCVIIAFPEHQKLFKRAAISLAAVMLANATFSAAERGRER